MAELDPAVMAELAKILHETQRLRRDVVALANRIEPFVDKEPGIAGTVETERFDSVPSVVDFLKGLRRSIVTSEFHLNAIRGRINEIAGNAVSRAEMKPWLKEKAPPG